MSDYLRRLPVYILLDCSGSMIGEPIAAVNQSLKALLSELRCDPQALEYMHLSIIVFDSSARQVIPLTELMQIKVPELFASGAAALGEALNVLMDCVNNEVRKSTETQKGDWRPLVFILTTGSPTDIEVFRKASQKIKSLKVGNIIACVAGSNVETSYLKQITESVLMMNTFNSGDIVRFFAWVSDTIKISSNRLNTKYSEKNEFPHPPQGFVIAP